MIGSPATEVLVIGGNMVLYLTLLLFGGRVLFDLGPGRVAAASGDSLTHSLGYAAALTTVILVPLTAMRSLALPPSAFWSWSQWQQLVMPGTLWLVAAVAAAAVVVPLVSASSMAVRSMSAIFVVAAVSAPALVGHSAALSLPYRAADAIHLIVAAVWLGGLSRMLGLLRRRNADAAGAEAAALVLANFSTWAAVSATVIAVSGTIIAIGRLSTWSELLDTAYGRTLLIKVGLVAVVIGVAAYNRLVVLGQVHKSPQAWAGLRRTAGYELAILIVVVVITAILTNTASGPMSH